MKIAFNYKTSLLSFDGDKIPFDTLRQYLLSNYPELCARNFIKAIKTPDGIVFTYDWEYIFHVAKTTGLIIQFAHKINTLRA